MLRDLKMENLSELDGGRIAVAFDRHLQRLIADCEDRPGDKKARKVTLTALVTPVILQDGAVMDVNVECEVASSVPKHISKTVECRLKHGNRAVFNDLSPDDVDQRTLDEVE